MKVGIGSRCSVLQEEKDTDTDTSTLSSGKIQIIYIEGSIKGVFMVK